MEGDIVPSSIKCGEVKQDKRLSLKLFNSFAGKLLYALCYVDENDRRMEFFNSEKELKNITWKEATDEL